MISIENVETDVNRALSNMSDAFGSNILDGVELVIKGWKAGGHFLYGGKKIPVRAGSPFMLSDWTLDARHETTRCRHTGLNFCRHCGIPIARPILPHQHNEATWGVL